MPHRIDTVRPPPPREGQTRAHLREFMECREPLLIFIGSLISRVQLETLGASRAFPFRSFPDAPGLGLLDFRGVWPGKDSQEFAQRGQTEPGSLDGCGCRRSFNSYNRHHPIVLVFGDVAMVNEVAKIRPAEIHSQRHGRKRMSRVAIPKGNLNRIEDLTQC